MDGFLLVDKPSAWTSFDVVAKVRSILRPHHKGIKVGHTGTLDPAATGLLIIVIGSYTKRADEFKNLDKTYRAEVDLSATSSTGDCEGDIQPVVCSPPTAQALEQARQALLGQIIQIPPAYSAIKINGQRAYKLARAGKKVEMPPRQVTIYSLDQLSYDYPKLSFICRVSSGTYIRSLAEDFAKQLQTGGYLSELRRLNIGRWSVDQAQQPDALEAAVIEQSLLKIDLPS